ncbi:uncharacterized protein BX664DRAFT_319982 [Halteromyces radiatus]|uniref:uncharacterized protein n=1 Tax=Halteromyces radiatus TaxID=101107 RepID=UPI002220269F|nr:uncharacterized protein BX664DRAFT_319982 [Halteromyces radiatus]KAI8098947.1 hypothetical protein BX664DRAFT_319982 [Halteromyces radiatus]
MMKYQGFILLCFALFLMVTFAQAQASSGGASGGSSVGASGSSSGSASSSSSSAAVSAAVYLSPNMAFQTISFLGVFAISAAFALA